MIWCAHIKGRTFQVVAKDKDEALIALYNQALASAIGDVYMKEVQPYKVAVIR